MKPFKITCLSFFVCFLASFVSAAQTDTLKVLFIGNSYTYTQNLPQIIAILSQSTPLYLSTRQSTAAGASLAQHWHGSRGLKSVELLESGMFDVVVLQAHSRAGIEWPDSLFKYASLFINRAKANGIKPYLLETWGRENEPGSFEQIRLCYQRIGIEYGASIIPVGTYWQLVSQMQWDLTLYSADGSHPDRLGVFLSALVITKALSGIWPQLINNDFSTSDYTGEFIQLMHVESKEYEALMDAFSKLTIEIK